MKTTIGLIPSTTKGIYLFVGVVNLVIGLYQLSNVMTADTWSLTLTLLLLLAGAILIAYVGLAHRSKNRWSPHIELDDEKLRIKEDIFKEAKKIRWTEVTKIYFQPYCIHFDIQNDDVVTVHLPSDAQTSIDVKQIIRQFARQKNIDVLGG
jgi:hypothetical protein